jgi:transposase
MMSAALRAEVRRLVLRDGWKINTVARKFGVHHSTIQRAIRGEAPEPSRQAPCHSALDPFKVLIVERLTQAPELTAVRLLAELRQHGFTHSIAILRRYVSQVRAPRARKAFMRVETEPGDVVQVDWGSFGRMRVGNTYRPLSAFVMALHWSRALYLDFSLDMHMDTFLRMHQRALAFFGGVPKRIIYDNLKTVVLHHVGSTVQFNPAFLGFAGHYLVEPVAAPVRYPQGKAKVEAGVLVAQRWIMARLRNRTFFSLEELNDAIAELLEELNTRPFQKLEGCRRSAFESIDRPAMKALPLTRYELAQWKECGVNIDYHVECQDRLYSVPCALIGQRVEIRWTSSAVEVFHAGQRVACHQRSYGPKGTAITCEEHRPKSHREYGQWPPERLVAWAASIGQQTGEVVREILARVPHPEMGYRSCLALIRISKRYGAERTEAACRKALDIGAPSRRTVEMILKNGLERDGASDEPAAKPVVHENIRGGTYFDRSEQNPETGKVGAQQEGQREIPEANLMLFRSNGNGYTH